MDKDIRAIHTLKGKLRLGEDDYRALLVNLTGVASSKDMSQAQRQQVRRHMQSLAERLLLTTSRRAWLPQAEFDAKAKSASPREKLVFVMWRRLHLAGKVRNGSRLALHGFVKRVTGADALDFCNGAQLQAVIAALQDWCAKEGVALR